ncbi:MAG: hypothetical protein ACF8R9_00165 [Phycisphaerales bacterium JB054]
MGFFERKLGAIGEAVDDGLDRARDRAGEMCDRQGWADRAAAARDRWVEGLGSAGLAIGERWRGLSRDAKRLSIAGGALVIVLVAVPVLRGTLVTRAEPVGDSDIALLERLRSQAARPSQWLGQAEPSGRAPARPAMPAGWD